MSSLRHRWPRGPTNELHLAVDDVSTERLVALLSEGSIDIDQGDPMGWTPLMIAAIEGFSDAVRILLNMRANVSIGDDRGVAALHMAAQEGHLAISKMLVNAGADLEASDSAQQVDTPLHMAAEKGHLGVMSVLIGAGANPDSRSLDGATPLFFAAQNGHMNAMKMLLSARANPLLAKTEYTPRRAYVPLDTAAQNGHLGVVRELVERFGIEGCGGASGGLQALRLAAMGQHLDVLAVLTDAGVVDPGVVLMEATARSRVLSTKFLLLQRAGDEAAYANYRGVVGATPLLHALGCAGVSSPSPRIARLLLDAGADTTTSAVRITNNQGEGNLLNVRPLTLVSLVLREKRIAGKDATEEQLHRLEGIRRLLLRVEAVHAVSFLWPAAIPSIVATVEGTGKTAASSAPLRMMLSILRRRARRPRVLLAALFRNSKKP